MNEQTAEPKYRGIPAHARETRVRPTYAQGPQPKDVTAYIHNVLRMRAKRAKVEAKP